jgi:membrane protein involved in colicin uptake
LAAERAAAERAAADRAAQERMAAERAASERAAADRLAQERLAQERVAAERLAQERAEQARLAREAEEKQQAARRAAAAGPRSGVLTWQGRLVKGEVVTITGTSASTGEVSGVALPGGAVLLQSGSGCTVSSAPVPSSGFKQFSFRCKQAGAVTAEFQWNKP